MTYKTLYKEVGGNEGNLCHYPARLDTYGCGCSHNCAYCYARSLLAFRGLWNPKEPKVGSFTDIAHNIRKFVKPGEIIRLGGMTDCFQEIEREARATFVALQFLNKHNIGYLIVTKSDLVADDFYIRGMRKDLAHIQISITSTDDGISRAIEPGAPLPGARIAAVEKLQREGFDVQVRLSPFVPAFIDTACINAIKCDKILVEFLRVNSWIRKWLTAQNVNLSAYIHKHGGYYHLPLEKKKELLALLDGQGHKLSVCEDVPEHWHYWQQHFNANPQDCCNLNND